MPINDELSFVLLSRVQQVMNRLAVPWSKVSGLALSHRPVFFQSQGASSWLRHGNVVCPSRCAGLRLDSISRRMVRSLDAG